MDVFIEHDVPDMGLQNKKKWVRMDRGRDKQMEGQWYCS